MASITSATSGPSSSGSTWVGGIVPGTTYAGTRTTSASASIGATTIALTAASPAVTAGKWLKIGTKQYRVATGLGTGAGNVVLDAPGLVEAVASGASVSVDMVDDKVTIAHPGTNNASSTAYLLNGAHSAGATTINVNTGSGTILAGECVQFEHSIGTDEDGLPIYDNTYYKVATTLAAGVIVIDAPGLAYAMASGVRVVNRGHVVELVADHVWGDDTSSTTPANNGIVVSGTLKASRSVSTTLVCRGTLQWNDNGTVDISATGDLIPNSVTANIVVGDSATLGAGKHGLNCTNRVNATVKIRGVVRTRNTRLTAGVSGGATNITVDASANWAVGDRLVIASDTDDPARSQIVVISGGSSPTWTVSAITNARSSGCLVGNLSSNVTVRSYSAAAPGVFAVFISSGSDTSRRYVDVGDIRIAEVGNTSAGWAGIATTPIYSAGFGLSAATHPPISVKRVAVETSANFGGRCGPASYPAAINRHVFSDWAITMGGAGEHGCYQAGSANADFVDIMIYKAANAHQCAFGGPISSRVLGGESWSTGFVAQGIETGRISLFGHNGRSLGQVFNAAGITYTFEACILSAPKFTNSSVVGGYGAAEFKNCTFTSTLLNGSNTGGSVPSQMSGAKLTNVNSDPSDNRVLSYYQTTVTDLTTRRRSTYAVKIQPKVANTAITYTFTLPAISGVAQKVKGSLRFDATYGTATPPSIALAGQGVSQSFTCAATADAWDNFEFDFTPTSTGDITATVTVQSTSTAGFAWLDGVWHYPMTQSVRHFGYQWLPQAAQVADTRITLSEAAALALPVSVDHGTNTITVSAPATAREVFEACIADLCQTANQGEAVHISSATGDTFSTTYTVAFSGAGAISGAYTDSAGLHVKIVAASLASGTRVQLFNVTDATEMLNTALTGAGLSHDLTYPGADKTIRLRAAKAGYLPITATGVLSSSGLSFLDAQVVDAVYVANGVDGSAVTGLTPDYPNLQIDADVADGEISVQEIYAWTRWANEDADGIRLMHNSVQAGDTANYQIDVAVVNAKFDNIGAGPLQIIGGYIRRTDDTLPIAAGSGSIWFNPGKAYVAAGAAAITVPTGERVITLASTGGFIARG